MTPSSGPVRIGAATARRIALAAQGFNDSVPGGPVDVRHFRRVMGRIGLLQLDSVQAVCRSHYLPVYSRLGPYDRDRLDAWLWRSGEVFEAWAHEASLVPVELEPLLRWLKDRARSGDTWPGLVAMAEKRPDYVASVLREVEQRGPVTAADLSDPRPRGGTWWDGRSDGKRAVDWLFRVGDVGSRRVGNFERTYEAFAGVVPSRIRSLTKPGVHEAQRDLLEIAGRCHGIGTAADLANYFRIGIREARPRLAELAAAASTGLEVEVARIPVWPETRQICGLLGLDPLRLVASGALLLGVPPSATGDVMAALRAEAIPVTRIGSVRRPEHGTILVSETGRSPFGPVAIDELARFYGSGQE